MVITLRKISSYCLKPALILMFACFSYMSDAAPDFNQTPASTKVDVIKCYPNPATSVINFEFPKNIDKSYVLQIYSFVGKQMVEVSVSGNKLSLPLNNDFYRGIYIFQLRDKAGKIVESGKFQVVR